MNFDKENLYNNYLNKLGVDIQKINDISLIYQRHGNQIFRVEVESTSYILKIFPEDNHIEIYCYHLFDELKISTLKLYSNTQNAILIEDLKDNENLRLSNQNDLTNPKVGIAIAKWYKKLHSVGYNYLNNTKTNTLLQYKIDVITSSLIMEIHKKLGLSHFNKFKIIADNLDTIKQISKELKNTIINDDFFWTNLALSTRGENCEAVIFDYHLIGIGLSFSDYRNILSSLKDEAAESFKKEYGIPIAQERIIDEVLSPLYTLYQAYTCSKFPKWGENAIKNILEPNFEKKIMEAEKLND